MIIEGPPEDNILPFPGPRESREPGPSPLMKRPAHLRSKPHCSHPSFYVDAQAREVECQTCGAMVDPFLALDRVAHREMQLIWARETLAALHKEQDVLKREIRNLKAQKRRKEMKIR